MKKSLSLLLALVLMLSMSVLAAPSTEIYFSLNVDDYATINDFVSDFTMLESNVSHGSVDDAAEVFAAANAVQDVEGATGGMFAAKEKNTQQFSVGTMDFGTNSLGRKTINTSTPSSGYNKNGAMIFVPKKSWNFIENSDEMFVISYDFEANPRGVYAVTMYHGDKTFWTDPTRTLNFNINGMWKVTSAGSSNVTLNANAGRVFSSGALGAAFTGGRTYRVAMGYAYDGGNQYTDNWNAATMGQTYYVPSRFYFKDGGYWTTAGKYKSTTDYGEAKNAAQQTVASHAWNGKPNLYAFTLTWQGEYGFEYSDIIAYTVSMNAATFGASLVSDTVELGDNVVVKFSQPIVPSSATKDSFTMTEDGNAFNLYEIKSVKTVIDETTGEVGTEVEFEFPYGLKADTTYVINLNTSGTMVKSEIMRTAAFGNTLTFTTGSAPTTNIVTFSAANKGLSGDGEAVSTLGTEQAKFTATATTMDKPTYLFIGIYDGLGNLESYTYTMATQGEELSLASKVASGYTVKAFACGSVYDLNQIFGTAAAPIN